MAAAIGAPTEVPRATWRDVYNALQNGHLVVDGRDAASFAAGHAAGAQAGSADVTEWESPDDPRVAVIYGPSVAADTEILAKVRRKLPRAVIRACEGDFAKFAAAYPAAVAAGDEPGASGVLPASIVPGLWLGSAYHAERADVFTALGLGAVVSMMDDPGGARGQPHAAGLAVHEFPWVDSCSFSIVDTLPAVVEAIDGCVNRAASAAAGAAAAGASAAAGTTEPSGSGGSGSGGSGGVLVHCYHGKSRSAAAVAAWLIARRGMDADAAHAYLQAARTAVTINDGFLQQLREFHASLPPAAGAAAGAVASSTAGDDTAAGVAAGAAAASTR